LAAASVPDRPTLAWIDAWFPFSVVDKVTDGRCKKYQAHCAAGQKYNSWVKKYCQATCSRLMDLGDVCYSIHADIHHPCKPGLKCGHPKYDNVPDATKECVRIEADGTVTTGASSLKSCMKGDLEYEHGTRFGTIGTECNEDHSTFQGQEEVCTDGKLVTVKRQNQACPKFRPYCCQKGQKGTQRSVMCSASKDSCIPWTKKGSSLQASNFKQDAGPKHTGMAGGIYLSGAVAVMMLLSL
jgi:hypothetical protein